LGLVAADKFTSMVVTLSMGVFAVSVWGLHFGWFGAFDGSLLILFASVLPHSAWYILRKIGVWIRVHPVNRSGRILTGLRNTVEGTCGLTGRQFSRMLVYSTLFYVTFISQFVVLLFAFEQVDVLYATFGVACVMVAKTIVPPFTLGELGIREGFSVFFLSMIGVSPTAAFGASVLLFLINILLPATAGGFMLLRTSLQPRLQQ
jgi:uncharacterized membrane protein YbhN (UPF0104 family)